MKDFRLKVTQTYTKTITIKAETEEEATEKMHSRYTEGKFFLDMMNCDISEFGGEVIGSKEINEDDYMKVLLVRPDSVPVVETIGKSLEDMQETVGGPIEAVYFFDDPIAIICNEEGKINGLPLCRSLKDESGNILDIIAGTFFIAGVTDEDFVSLPDEMVEKYTKIFKNQETYIRIGEKIIAIPKEAEE